MVNDTVKILIIDDNQANIFSLEKLLEQPGRSFLSASNGNDGLRIALSDEIDLIMLDVQMPEMDGFEVAQVLKSNKKTKEIPIIFASAERKEKNFMMKGFEEGGVDYLFKPLDAEITKAKVSVLLKIQQQKKELIEKNTSLQKAEAQIRELNAELKANLTQLEAVNKELESFSYSVSHDLRAPLRSLIGYSQILQEDCAQKLNDHELDALSVIQKNARKMDQLIEALLDFSRSGKKELTKSLVDSEQMVGQILIDVNAAIPNKAAIIMKVLPQVHADSTLLSQVWTNLIGNAVKYSSKKESPAIEIGSARKDNDIVFYVKDNGAGFDMNHMDRLFGVFQRLHRQQEFEGTGIGLALVQRIINRHGGAVWAEGKVDDGATFYFSLPENGIAEAVR
jgi:two-component system sensor histidine kinase/response regulator